MRKFKNMLLPIMILISALAVACVSLILCGASKRPISTLMRFFSGDTAESEDDDWDDETDGTVVSEETEITSETVAEVTETEAASEQSGEPKVSDSLPESSVAVAEPPTEPTTQQRREPETTKKPLREKDIDAGEWFSDALFLGDSRTLGLWKNAKIDGADFYGRNLMTVYSMWDEKNVETLKRTTDLKTFLKQKQYGKIYILLGANEISGSKKKITAAMEDDIARIRVLQPDAIIVIQGNFHTSAEREAKKTAMSNSRIDALNKSFAGLCDGEYIFYLDTSSIYDDDSGYFNPALTKDGCHPYAKYYYIWRDYVMEHCDF